MWSARKIFLYYSRSVEYYYYKIIILEVDPTGVGHNDSQPTDPEQKKGLQQVRLFCFFIFWFTFRFSAIYLVFCNFSTFNAIARG